ncbi:hypothetical protein [Allokutzneria oryzae]|uniref:SPW repeat-containing protein n=1 Tax=Allokutzneria oryzae TaxID=1378989 RepID=A0ABV5ZP96_9PSEU
MTRWVLGGAGVALGLWGAVLALPLLTGPEMWSFGAWLLGGPVLHDVLVAPLVGGIGLLLYQSCSPRWASLLAGGLVTTGVLGLIAVPLLWAPNAPANPGLHDRDYGSGLLVALGVVWLVVLVAGVWPRGKNSGARHQRPSCKSSRNDASTPRHAVHA